MLSITTKSPYALQALVELHRQGSAGPVPIAELARRREIPVQFLEQLFATLLPRRRPALPARGQGRLQPRPSRGRDHRARTRGTARRSPSAPTPPACSRPRRRRRRVCSPRRRSHRSPRTRPAPWARRCTTSERWWSLLSGAHELAGGDHGALVEPTEQPGCCDRGVVERDGGADGVFRVQFGWVLSRCARRSRRRRCAWCCCCGVCSAVRLRG